MARARGPRAPVLPTPAPRGAAAGLGGPPPDCAPPPETIPFLSNVEMAKLVRKCAGIPLDDAVVKRLVYLVRRAHGIGLAGKRNPAMQIGRFVVESGTGGRYAILDLQNGGKPIAVDLTSDEAFEFEQQLALGHVTPADLKKREGKPRRKEEQKMAGKRKPKKADAKTIMRRAMKGT